MTGWSVEGEDECRKRRDDTDERPGNRDSETGVQAFRSEKGNGRREGPVQASVQDRAFCRVNH